MQRHVLIIVLNTLFFFTYEPTYAISPVTTSSGDNGFIHILPHYLLLHNDSVPSFSAKIGGP